MNKTAKIDLSADRLISIADDCLEAHDYIQALKMLNKNAALNGNDEDSYMLYAEAFDDMGLYEKCVNGWFKYIDYADDEADLVAAYESIAVSFMNMRMDNFAAYYYNKLLMETDEELTSEDRKQIIDAFLQGNDKPALKFVYPPRLVDYSEHIEAGMSLMSRSDFDSAVSEFEKVDEHSDKYVSARNYIAMCNVIGDKYEEAEEECRAILERDPDNVQALTTLAAVKGQQHKRDEAIELARRLLKINPDEGDELFKIATVCCENGLHDEAYPIFCRLDERFDYDCSLLFFKAVSAFNSGRVEKSLETFDTLLTVYPNAVTAEYWYNVALEEKDKPEKERKVLEYFYRLPRHECEATIGLLTAFYRLKDKLAEKFCEEADILSAVHWCVDDGDSNLDSQLKLLGAMCAVKGRLDDAVRDILLDAFQPDDIKFEIIKALVMRNEEDVFGVVVFNFYNRLPLVPVNIGRNRKTSFLRAYALAFSRFAMLEPENPYLLSAATESLYIKLEAEGRLKDCGSASALAAAILIHSTVKAKELSEEQICKFFGASVKKVKVILED